MNREQTVILTRIVKSACPQQSIDKFTPNAWYDLLDDLDFDDCREAVSAVGKRQAFIAPAEIRAEVRRIREDRIARSVIPAPPPELADNPRAYQRALQAGIAQAAEGKAPLAADQPRPLALTDGQRELRDSEPPRRLGAAMAELRRILGPARARSRHLASPQEIAARQAREARERAERESGEAESA